MLATGRSVDGSYVVATNQALHATGGRLPYEEILKAVWHNESATLEVWEPSRPDGHVAIVLAEAGQLPETVWERVQATILLSRHVPLRGEQGVLITARRSSSGGGVWWTMMFDPGLDSKDPAVRADAEAVLSHLRDRSGL